MLLQMNSVSLLIQIVSKVIYRGESSHDPPSDIPEAFLEGLERHLPYWSHCHRFGRTKRTYFAYERLAGPTLRQVYQFEATSCLCESIGHFGHSPEVVV